MDTELVQRLIELKEGMARIDERTIAIHDSQEKLGEALLTHEERDRLDFKEVDHRFNSVERKQNWMLGVGTASVFVLGLAVTFIRGLFTGG